MKNKQKLKAQPSHLTSSLWRQKIHRISALILPLVFASSSLQAQQSLTLFEPIEGDSAGNRASAAAPPRIGSADTAPVFSLVGTTRIGNQHSVLLQHSTGETLSLPVKTGQLQAIPEHADFQVMLSEEGEVQLQYPSSRVCLPFEELGVSCDRELNRAQLSIARAEPLSVAEVHQSDDLLTDDEPENGDSANTNDAEEAPGNPFEALRQRAARGQRGDVVNPDEQNRRFRPRRIDPNNIPPGKRVVSTPFGDRLVDI